MFKLASLAWQITRSINAIILISNVEFLCRKLASNQ